MKGKSGTYGLDVSNLAQGEGSGGRGGRREGAWVGPHNRVAALRGPLDPDSGTRTAPLKHKGSSSAGGARWEDVHSCQADK